MDKIKNPASTTSIAKKSVVQWMDKDKKKPVTDKPVTQAVTKPKKTTVKTVVKKANKPVLTVNNTTIKTGVTTAIQPEPVVNKTVTLDSDFPTTKFVTSNRTSKLNPEIKVTSTKHLDVGSKTTVLHANEHGEPVKSVTNQSESSTSNSDSNAAPQQILNVEKLNKYFVKSGKLVQVLHDIEFSVNEKDFFGIIGESGSGKSTTGKCLIRLYSSSSGIVTFDNHIVNQSSLTLFQKIGRLFNYSASPVDEITLAINQNKLNARNKASNKERKNWLYKNMSMIFQDPMSSLNPRKNVLTLVSEPLVINNTIKKDVKEILKIYEETNPYFQNTYQNQDSALAKKYMIPFYQKNIALFEQTIAAIGEIPNDVSQITALLETIADLESTYKSTLNLMSSTVNEMKQLVYSNNALLLSGKVHPTETAYYKAEKKLKQETKNLEASPEYVKLQKHLEAQQTTINDYIQRQKSVYEFRNLPRFRSILNSLQSESKSMRQDMRLTHSITDHLFKKTDFYIKNDTYKALKEVIATYGAGVNAYFELDEMEAFYDFITDRIKSKYTSLTNDTSRLVQLSEKIDSFNNDEVQSPEVLKILDEYPNLYARISSELEVLKDVDFIQADPTVKEAINKIVDRSFEIKEKIANEIRLQQFEVLKTLKAMEACKIAHDQQKSDTSEAFELAKKNFELAKQERQKFVDADDLEFNTNILPGIKQQLLDVQAMDDKLYSLNKTLVKLVHKKARAIVKLLKRNPDYNPDKAFKETLERWMKVFSAEEKTKRDTIDIFTRNIKNSIVGIGAVNFEVITSLQTIALCRKLRSKNKAVLWSCFSALKTLVTRDYVYSALDEVGLKTEHAYRYPHEFSGGQRQRIVIARALISKPKLIIADEPISALDVSIQAQVINIMKDLAKKHNITFIFIAHDLSMVKYVSNRLIIMHKGKIVEKGFTDEVFKNPVHPYTKSLIKASPELSKIHVDLASFSSKLDYDKNYSINNRPSFFSVSDKYEHFVFATQDQIKKWKK